MANIRDTVESAPDVTAVHRLVQAVVQHERCLRDELFALTSRKDDLSNRLACHKNAIKVTENLIVDAFSLHSEVLKSSALSETLSCRIRKLCADRNNIQNTIAFLAIIEDKSTAERNILASLEGENYESLASNFEAFCLLCESLPVHNNARNDLLLRDRILSIFRDELASAISKYEVDQVLRIGFLFPKIGLREEGFKRVSMYLGSSINTRIINNSIAKSSTKNGESSMIRYLFRSIVNCTDHHSSSFNAVFGPNSDLELLLELNAQTANCLSHFLASCLKANQNLCSKSDIDSRELGHAMDGISDVLKEIHDYRRWLRLRQVDVYSLGDVQVIDELLKLYDFLQSGYIHMNIEIALELDSRDRQGTRDSFIDDVFFIFNACLGRVLTSGIPKLLKDTLDCIENVLMTSVLEHLRKNIHGESSLTLFNRSHETCCSIQRMTRNYSDGFMGVNNRLVTTSLAYKDFASSQLSSLLKEFSLELSTLLSGHLKVLNYTMDENLYLEHESADPWVQPTLFKLLSILHNLRSRFTRSAFNQVTESLIESFVTAVEAIIINDTMFTQLGGLQLEREIRRIVFKLSTEFPEVPIREQFSRLLQISSVLTLEHPEEAVDYLQVNFSRTSLSENDMKRVLSLRADFKVGAITSLQFHLACAS